MGAGARRVNVSGWGVAALAGVAATVAAGTLPDVIKGWLGDSRFFLTLLCLVAAAAFTVISRLQQRTKGVGIVVTLRQDSWRAPWSRQWPLAAEDHAQRHHDSCFVVQRDIRSVDPDDPDPHWPQQRLEQLDVAWELVNARLMEAAACDPAAPVSLYVNAALPDAYDLGAKLKFNVQRSFRAVTSPVLRQRAEVPGFDFHPALRLSGRLKEPLRPQDSERAKLLAPSRTESLTPAEADADQVGQSVALVVHLAHNPAMVAEAREAARRGCADSTGAQAVCRAALVVDGSQANLPENTEDFELVVRHVYTAWGAWLRDNPEYAALDKRLFLAAPVSIALTLGWLLGHTVRTIPHPYIRLGEGNR